MSAPFTFPKRKACAAQTMPEPQTQTSSNSSGNYENGESKSNGQGAQSGRKGPGNRHVPRSVDVASPRGPSEGTERGNSTRKIDDVMSPVSPNTAPENKPRRQRRQKDKTTTAPEIPVAASVEAGAPSASDVRAESGSLTTSSFPGEIGNGTQALPNGSRGRERASNIVISPPSTAPRAGAGSSDGTWSSPFTSSYTPPDLSPALRRENGNINDIQSRVGSVEDAASVSVPKEEKPARRRKERAGKGPVVADEVVADTSTSEKDKSGEEAGLVSPRSKRREPRKKFPASTNPTGAAPVVPSAAENSGGEVTPDASSLPKRGGKSKGRKGGERGSDEGAKEKIEAPAPHKEPLVESQPTLPVVTPTISIPAAPATAATAPAPAPPKSEGGKKKLFLDKGRKAEGGEKKANGLGYYAQLQGLEPEEEALSDNGDTEEVVEPSVNSAESKKKKKKKKKKAAVTETDSTKATEAGPTKEEGLDVKGKVSDVEERDVEEESVGVQSVSISPQTVTTSQIETAAPQQAERTPLEILLENLEVAAKEEAEARAANELAEEELESAKISLCIAETDAIEASSRLEAAVAALTFAKMKIEFLENPAKFAPDEDLSEKKVYRGEIFGEKVPLPRGVLKKVFVPRLPGVRIRFDLPPLPPDPESETDAATRLPTLQTSETEETSTESRDDSEVVTKATKEISRINQNIGEKGGLFLAFSIEKCGSLFHLSSVSLPGNNLSDESIGTLCGALMMTAAPVAELNVSDNCISATGAVSISSFLKSCQSLSNINISHNNICGRGVRALCAKPIAWLKKLNINSNSIFDEGGAIVGKCLTDTRCRITHLDVGNNSLKSVRLLSHSPTIIDLNVSDNPISDQCVQHLKQLILKSSSLRSLSLRATSLTDKGLTLLVSAISKQKVSLVSLDFSSSYDCSKKGLERAAESLAKSEIEFLY